MRLIDADKLYDWVKRECNPYGKPTIDFESGNSMLDMIKRSSTAFDKEKVIDELEYDKEMSAKYRTGLRERGHIEAFDEAISIVKKGGINNILL